MEGIHSKAQYIVEREGLREYKRSSSRTWEKIECRSKKTRKVRDSRKKRL